MKKIMAYLWWFTSTLESRLQMYLYPDYVIEFLDWFIEYIGETKLMPSDIVRDLEIGRLRTELKHAKKDLEDAHAWSKIWKTTAKAQRRK